MLLSGVSVALALKGPASAGFAILLAIIGLALWIPFYALRMLGAGDVKLFGACCAWLATMHQVLLAAAAAAIVGGLLAVVWAVIQRRAVPVVGSILTRVHFKVPLLIDSQRAKVPYGVAMAIGVLWS